MTKIRFSSMPTDRARAYWAGATDAHGQEPEVHISDGGSVPCRHCQQDVAEGERYLILAHSPFPRPQPYAEVGPIFLHAEPCERYPETDKVPAMFLERESYLLKGYCAADRIIYGTGRIVKSAGVAEAASRILDRDEVKYVHVRSALNNCFICRVDREEEGSSREVLHFAGFIEGQSTSAATGVSQSRSSR